MENGRLWCRRPQRRSDRLVVQWTHSNAFSSPNKKKNKSISPVLQKKTAAILLILARNLSAASPCAVRPHFVLSSWRRWPISSMQRPAGTLEPLLCRHSRHLVFSPKIHKTVKKKEKFRHKRKKPSEGRRWLFWWIHRPKKVEGNGPTPKRRQPVGDDGNNGAGRCRNRRLMTSITKSDI